MEPTTRRLLGLSLSLVFIGCSVTPKKPAARDSQPHATPSRACQIQMMSNYLDSNMPNEGVSLEYSAEDLKRNTLGLVEVWHSIGNEKNKRRLIEWTDVPLKKIRGTNPLVDFGKGQLQMSLRLPSFDNPTQQSLVSFTAKSKNYDQPVMGHLHRGQHKAVFHLKTTKRCLDLLADKEM